MCSLAARGLWVELLAVAHQAEPYGHVLVNGRSPTTQQLSILVGAAHKDVECHIKELELAGVFSRTSDGTIFSRRMVRDKAKVDKDRENGKDGGNPSLKGGDNAPNKPPDKGGVNPPVKGGDKAQKPEARGQKENNSVPQNLVSAPAATKNSSFSRICEALGGFEAVRRWTNLQAISAIWLGDADLDADILPTIRDVLAKRNGELPGSAAYFTSAIRDAKTKRLNGNGSAGLKPMEVTREEWDGRLRAWQQWNSWKPSWGPRPIDSGCLAPPDLIAKRMDVVA